MITGGWAEAFVQKANELGWKIRLDHMTESPPRWVEPVRIRHHEYEIVTLGPPQAQDSSSVSRWAFSGTWVFET